MIYRDGPTNHIMIYRDGPDRLLVVAGNSVTLTVTPVK